MDLLLLVLKDGGPIALAIVMLAGLAGPWMTVGALVAATGRRSPALYVLAPLGFLFLLGISGSVLGAHSAARALATASAATRQTLAAAGVQMVIGAQVATGIACLSAVPASIICGISGFFAGERRPVKAIGVLAISLVAFLALSLHAALLGDPGLALRLPLYAVVFAGAVGASLGETNRHAHVIATVIVPMVVGGFEAAASAKGQYDIFYAVARAAVETKEIVYLTGMEQLASVRPIAWLVWFLGVALALLGVEALDEDTVGTSMSIGALGLVLLGPVLWMVGGEASFALLMGAMS